MNRKLRNGLILSFRFQPWPVSFDIHARVTADGALICAADAYNARAYGVNQLANVRDFDFDFGSAFRAASLNPRLSLLDSNFESDLAPRIRAAYYGRPTPLTVVAAFDSLETKEAQTQLVGVS